MNNIKRNGAVNRIAIILDGHMNKNSAGKANYRNLGSIDISAAARSVWVVGKLNKLSEIKVLAQLKTIL